MDDSATDEASCLNLSTIWDYRDNSDNMGLYIVIYIYMYVNISLFLILTWAYDPTDNWGNSYKPV